MLAVASLAREGSVFPDDGWKTRRATGGIIRLASAEMGWSVGVAGAGSVDMPACWARETRWNWDGGDTRLAEAGVELCSWTASWLVVRLNATLRSSPLETALRGGAIARAWLGFGLGLGFVFGFEFRERSPVDLRSMAA